MPAGEVTKHQRPDDRKKRTDDGSHQGSPDSRHRGGPSSPGTSGTLRAGNARSALAGTNRDADGRGPRRWRGQLEGHTGRPGDDDAAYEAGEARPAHGSRTLLREATTSAWPEGVLISWPTRDADPYKSLAFAGRMTDTVA